MGKKKKKPLTTDQKIAIAAIAVTVIMWLVDKLIDIISRF